MCECLHHRQCLCVHAVARAAWEGCLSHENSERGETYLKNKIFLLNLCLHKRLVMEDSPYHLLINTDFLSNKFMRQSHHPNIPPQASWCCFSTTVHVHVGVHQWDHRPEAFPAQREEKVTQDPNPQLSDARDQEGEQLQILNKWEQTGPTGETQRSSFKKQFAKTLSSYLFIARMAEAKDWKREESSGSDRRPINILH